MDSEYFLPTFDDGWLWKLKDMCRSTNLESLSKKQRNVCNNLIERRYVNIPGAKSYTTHHWVHIDMNKEKYMNMSATNVAKIVNPQQLANVKNEIKRNLT